jgi:type II secretory pathway component PulF
VAQFSYRARDEKGSLVTGTLEGENQGSIMAQLDTMDLIPISVKAEGGKGLSFPSFDKHLLSLKKVKYDDIVFFTRQLRTIIRTGIPFLSGLSALEEQTKNERLKVTIRGLCEDIDAGMGLADAFAKRKAIFPEVYVSMIQAGEVSGALDEMLERLCVVLEFQMKTKEMLKSALRYPMFVIATLCVAFIVVIRFVVPKFSGIFKSAKMELPLPTKILLFISDAFENYGIPLLLLLVAIGVSFYLYKRTKAGALNIDRMKIRVPLMGPIILDICMSRFAFLLENMVRAGVPIVQALSIVSKAIGNEWIAAKIDQIGTKIEGGKGISGPMKEARIFPLLVVHLVSTAEETGTLEEMLKEVALHYDREVTYSLTRLSAWIEPVLTAGLSVMVLFLALAIFLPWWNMMGALKGGG